MRPVYAAALAAVLGLGCQEASAPDTLNKSAIKPPGVGAGTGSLRAEAVVLGPGSGNDTLSLDPLAGAAVRIYKKEVTVVTCDSTGTNAPTCQERTYTVAGAASVNLPGGGTARGALAASGTTGSDGAYVAAGLDAWIYFVIVDGPAGGNFTSAAAVHVPVGDGGTATARLMLPVR
jgi:hypothetical protein